MQRVKSILSLVCDFTTFGSEGSKTGKLCPKMKKERKKEMSKPSEPLNHFTGYKQAHIKSFQLHRSHQALKCIVIIP